jgi:hypothetical protein
MKAMSKTVALLAVAAALTSSCSHVFAKTDIPQPSRASGTSVSVTGQGAGGGEGKRPWCPSCYYHYQPPGHSQPPCRGPHRGPNGVMIQCD